MTSIDNKRACTENGAEILVHRCDLLDVYRVCVGCGEAKPESDFYKTQKRRRCKDCLRSRRRWKYRQENPRKYHRDRQQFSRNRSRFFRQKSYNLKSRHVGERSASKIDLVRLWDNQGGRCAVTGVTLHMDMAHLDHIVPASAGGTGDVSNLRWVHKFVNMARGTMDDESFRREFLEVARAMVFRAS